MTLRSTIRHSCPLLVLSIASLLITDCNSPEAPPPPPTPPATVTVEYAGRLIEYQGRSIVRVSWSDAAASPASYIVTRTLQRATPTPIGTVAGTVRSILDTIPGPGIFRYSVAALSEGGQVSSAMESDWINLVGLSSATVTRRYPAQLEVRWSALQIPGAIFRIDRKLDDGPYRPLRTVDEGTRSIIDTMPGYYTFRYRITAIAGADSAETVETDTISYNWPFVTDFSASYYDQEYLRLSWKDQNPMETGFVIELSVDGTPLGVRSTPGANSVTVIDTAREFGNHSYTIRAVAGPTSSARMSAPSLAVTHWLPALNTVRAQGQANPIGLPNGDVLAFSISGTWVYSFNARRWETAGTMQSTSMPGLGITLKDGRVLKVLGAVGEITPGGAAQYLNEVYNPVSRTWSVTGSFQTPLKEPAGCRLALLPDGRVLAVGWYSTQGYMYDSIRVFTEVYDPAAGTFSSAAPYPSQRGNMALAVLPSGEVLAAGGAFPLRTSSSVPPTENYLYDPAANVWSSAGQMPVGGFYLSAIAGTGGDRLLVFGDAILTYEAQSGIWTNRGGTPHIFAACPLSGDEVYILAGTDSPLMVTLLRLSLSTGGLTTVEPFPVSRMPSPCFLRTLPNGRLLATDGAGVEVYIERL